MMYCKHKSNNKVFSAPPGTEADVGDLPVTVRHDAILGLTAVDSYWEPSKADLDALVRGEKIVLTIYGGGHPIVSINVAP